MSFPFLLISWKTSLLEGLLQVMLDDREENLPNDLSRVAIVFPHKRPEGYISSILKKDLRFSRPLMLPRFFTVNTLFSFFASSLRKKPALEASLLDRIGLLIDVIKLHPELMCVLANPAEQEDLWASESMNTKKKNVEKIDTRYFFPWGVKIVSLFEECFTHGKTPDNFLYNQGGITPFAARLLENLNLLFEGYVSGLTQRNWTTPAYDAFFVAKHLEQGSKLPSIFSFENIYLTGFFGLTGTEKNLFYYLWKEHGAKILIHGDEELVNGKSFHWSCKPLYEWMKSWKTSIEEVLLKNSESSEDFLSYQNIQKEDKGSKHNQNTDFFEDSTAQEERKKNYRIRYIEGFDLHSQLSFLTKEMEKEQEKFSQGVFAADTVVVLPDSGLLMPALHHLPVKDINISMGYPLLRSPLFRLIDTVFKLQEEKRGNEYYQKDFIELLRHPYLKMLAVEESSILSFSKDTPNSDTEDFSLRRELHRIEQELRKSRQKYIIPSDVIFGIYETMPVEELPAKPILALIEKTFDIICNSFADLETPLDMAKALSSLTNLLLEYGKPLWKRFPIDAECLFRLIQSLIPELFRSALSNEVLSSPTLFAIVRQLMKAERVPFDATPLVGLQVLGVLETRLLTFRKVIFLDATEDILPGEVQGDPLLPDALRVEIGLPDIYVREGIAAYHFFRLIAGAKDVVLLWQEAADSSGIQDGKKKKSRFIEELLWEEEKKIGRLLENKGQDGPLTVLSSSFGRINKTKASIQATPEIRSIVNGILARPVSATFLDSYLKCPARFYYERILGLYPSEEIVEDSDPLAIGKLIHTTLQEFYESRLLIPLADGTTLVKDHFPELLEIFVSQPEYVQFSQTIPADSFSMLKAAGKLRLCSYLSLQPQTTVLALEHAFNFSLAVNSSSVILTGNADRVDLRPEGLCILDYKTGSLPKPSSQLWSNHLLWTRMEQWTANLNTFRASSLFFPEDDPLPELSTLLGSTQLPLYMYLLKENINSLPMNYGGYDADSIDDLKIANASWIVLSENGREEPLFSKKISFEEKEKIVLDYVPILVRFLLRHMTTADYYYPNPGKHCEWCFLANVCIVAK